MSSWRDRFDDEKIIREGDANGRDWFVTVQHGVSGKLLHYLGYVEHGPAEVPPMLASLRTAVEFELQLHSRPGHVGFCSTSPYTVSVHGTGRPFDTAQQNPDSPAVTAIGPDDMAERCRSLAGQLPDN